MSVSLLKVGSKGRQHQHLLGACGKRRISGSSPDLLSQILHLTLGNCYAYLSLKDAGCISETLGKKTRYLAPSLNPVNVYLGHISEVA